MMVASVVLVINTEEDVSGAKHALCSRRVGKGPYNCLKLLAEREGLIRGHPWPLTLRARFARPNLQSCKFVEPGLFLVRGFESTLIDGDP